MSAPKRIHADDWMLLDRVANGSAQEVFDLLEKGADPNVIDPHTKKSAMTKIIEGGDFKLSLQVYSFALRGARVGRWDKPDASELLQTAQQAGHAEAAEYFQQFVGPARETTLNTQAFAPQAPSPSPPRPALAP